MVESINELKKICRSKNYKDRKKSFYIESVLSIYITKLLLFTPITPNGITVLFWIIGIISGILFLSQNLLTIIIAFLLYKLHITLDLCDGEVARYKKMTSIKGAFIDYIAHYTIFPTILFGIGYSILKINQDIRFVIVIFLSILFYILQMSIQDSWYRANFGKAIKTDIDDRDKHTIKSKLSQIKSSLILIIASITNFKSFLNIYLIISCIVHFNPKLFYLKEIVYILYSILFLILSSGRFVYILYKGKIPRKGAYYKA